MISRKEDPMDLSVVNIPLKNNKLGNMKLIMLTTVVTNTISEDLRLFHPSGKIIEMMDISNIPYRAYEQYNLGP